MAELEKGSQQTLQYVRDMLQQLVSIVPAQAGPLLPHLIRMAQMEASELALHLPPTSKDTRAPG